MQTIDGKEYELPFVDKVIMPIMPDEATRITALRTGKIDINLEVSLLHKDTLAKTSPELIKNDKFVDSTYVVMLQWRHGTWLDKQMRHALKMGTDIQAIVDSILLLMLFLMLLMRQPMLYDKDRLVSELLIYGL